MFFFKKETAFLLRYISHSLTTWNVIGKIILVKAENNKLLHENVQRGKTLYFYDKKRAMEN